MCVEPRHVNRSSDAPEQGLLGELVGTAVGLEPAAQAIAQRLPVIALAMAAAVPGHPRRDDAFLYGCE